jgi:alpha-tubulin suppressor-like RCC1 family protein
VTSPTQGPVQVSLPAAAIDIAAAEGNSAAVLADGRVLVWGADDYGQIGDGTTSDGLPQPYDVPAVVADVSGALNVDLGGAHVLAALRG